MSKSKGNVISPDEVIEKYGADVLRLYEMFLGSFEDDVAWSEDGVNGMRRFLDKVWTLSEKVGDTKKDDHMENSLHKTIKKVTDDIENFKFNTAISALMSLGNEMKERRSIQREAFEDYIKLLSPFVPHFCEELWRKIGNKPSVFYNEWPQFKEEKAKDTLVTLVVQVNGKVRSQMEVESGTNKEDVQERAKKEVEKWIKEKKVKKTVFVKDKLINFVTE